MQRRLLTLLAETPVHAGGSAAEGAVDLPIQRESSTGLPVIWGQSLKGALRDAARGQSWEIDVFGDPPPSGQPSGDTAGADQPVAPHDRGGELRKGTVSIGDAQLLAFPAATLRNTFAWTTCPLLLHRLQRKASLLGATLGPALSALIPAGNSIGPPGWNGTQVIGPYVDEVDVRAQAATAGSVLGELACPGRPEFDYTRRKMRADLLVLADDVLRELTTLGTDVVARIQLKETAKTVAHGPFYSEHLPTETVLVAVLASETAAGLDHLGDLLDGKPIQLGGDETIGKGLLWCRVHDADSVQAALTTGTAAEAEAPAHG
jgi:CRISPR-associated protein Cmr4